LHALYNPDRIPSDSPFRNSQLPVEIFLEKELSNPHSRAKKHLRWLAHKNYEKSLLKDYIDAEMKDMQGRTKGDAIADATWKWREKLATERSEKRKLRWKLRGHEAKHERRVKRRVRKHHKQMKRLTEFSLRPEPNQVIPPPS
jgi:hypothetical protein